MILRSPEERRRLLERVRTVFIVGASGNHIRPSYIVYRYLLSHGMTVYPVNPSYAEIDGARCYPSLTACAAEHGIPDVVDVFRKPEEVVPIAREAIAIGAKVIWFQYGVINEDAIRIADEAGLDVVYDRCMKVEHARFHGGLTTAGMNSGVISSKRRP